jgi:NAD(P)-dependent dehydrogenase (short-subunit alcohol dehydrogenase family)
VAIHHRQSHDEAAALVAEIAANGGESFAVAADLAQAPAADALVRDVVTRCGRLDVLVNSAANMLRTPVGSVTPDQFDEIFALNTRAPLLLSQAAAPHMREGGVIVNMADLAAFETWAGYIPHAMSKAAIVQMVRTAAAEFAPKGVRVNAVGPGVVETPLTAPIKANADWYGAYAAKSALQRWATPDEMAWPTVFLLSDAASYITGTVLFVDGGWLAVDGRFAPPGMAG